MAFDLTMADAVAGNIASAADYNKHKNNLLDLNTRVIDHATRLAVVEAWNAGTRLTSLESLTTNTTTNGGHGNVRLSDRLGTGVGTGTNVTTGNAASQLADLRTRTGVVETRTTAAGSGNAALDTRVGVLESTAGITALVSVTRATVQSISNNANNYVSWSGVVNGRNTGGTMWVVGNSTRLVAPTTGLYFLNGLFVVAPNSTNYRSVGIRINGTTIKRVFTTTHNGGNYSELPLATHVELTANDYIEVYIWQNSGVALNLEAVDSTPWLVMRRVA
jgi:hypothetical protein